LLLKDLQAGGLRLKLDGKLVGMAVDGLRRPSLQNRASASVHALATPRIWGQIGTALEARDLWPPFGACGELETLPTKSGSRTPALTSLMRSGSLDEGGAPQIKKAAERLPRTEQTFVRKQLYQRDNNSQGKVWRATPRAKEMGRRRAPGLKPSIKQAIISAVPRGTAPLTESQGLPPQQRQEPGGWWCDISTDRGRV
jgi:hypothetical protein